MIADAEKNGSKYEIVAIDMSKAFECINRKKLLEVLKEIIDPSECQMIRYILSNTNLTSENQRRVWRQIRHNGWSTPRRRTFTDT